MKLCMIRRNGGLEPACVDDEGVVRSLVGHCGAIGANLLAPSELARLATLDLPSLPAVTGNIDYAPPIVGSSKFICIGLNFRDHARETGAAIPPEPIIFMKATTAISGANDPIMQPRDSTQLDWEVELGVVIGQAARYVEREQALDHVAGYCVINDVSERAFQLQSQQWDKGKGCDTFGPIGPWLVTSDEVGDPRALGMWLDVNGVRMQSGTTSDMIFDVAELVSYVSRYMTLLPGDIISTGTPAGVGIGQKPSPVWLKPGDVIELGIDGLGRQRQRVEPFAL